MYNNFLVRNFGQNVALAYWPIFDLCKTNGWKRPKKMFALMNIIHIDTRTHTPERKGAKNRFVTEFIVYSVVLWKFPILHVDLSLLQRTATARTNERTSERAHETFPEGPIAFPFDLWTEHRRICITFLSLYIRLLIENSWHTHTHIHSYTNKHTHWQRDRESKFQSEFAILLTWQKSYYATLSCT